ncbi:hypothetical protein L1987_33634 [Smallanthus sonchifolius]|uniref:Uncharacterized protein n=1 Tax=Smallanthus sonchifolius TaxID=185202 RepID=A0ACB9HST0_9ASTR|nr:hypothetical protein L1987_33634 [Smallanthus sonchifolius]
MYRPCLSKTPADILQTVYYAVMEAITMRFASYSCAINGALAAIGSISWASKSGVGDKELVQINAAASQNDLGNSCSSMIDSPNGTMYWIPDVPVDEKPVEGIVYTSFEEARKMYECYADKAAFSVVNEDGVHVRFVIDKDKMKQDVYEFKVVIYLNELKMECSCLKFGRIGYLCRHIFFVLKDLDVDEIPDIYVLNRWRRDALPQDFLKLPMSNGSMGDKTDDMFSEAVSIVESCASRLRGDVDKMTSFLDNLKQMKHEIFNDIPEEPSANNKEEVFKALLGVETPNQISVFAPRGIRNKGCGTNKENDWTRFCISSHMLDASLNTVALCMLSSDSSILTAYLHLNRKI